ncbi:ATP-binding cassette domain-containing protein [Tepidimonas taiwanensis]|uniref:Glutamine transport ATP-binding protein GlnQ n=1 Tax=Tepidimonas taiwanensis TaxID=307486 RepID=A0A554X8Q8_9BURK|nr:Glutamine transport ATP-binding protein GlnQ [Tepidimonas taiwanensis]
MTVVFALRGVQARLGTRRPVAALRDIDLCVRAGERVALVGANGSGKSTLLRVLMGLVPVQGHLERADVRAAMVFQRPYLMRLSARHNVAVALWVQGRRWSQACAAAREALARVGLVALADRPARALSGGQQQRLALARAWAQRPDVWLLDEPTASLDPQARQEVEALIAAFAAETGATVVFSSHHLGQVRRLATRVVYLDGGRIAADLPVEAFFDLGRLAQASPSAHAFVREELPWVG